MSRSRAEFKAQLVVGYGGMAAEETFLGDVSTGPRQDIAQATDIARQMVMVYGMSDAIGAINYGIDRPNPFGMGGGSRDVPVSETTAREIDNEVRRILDEAREKARSIVRENRAVIEAMAAALLEKETLDGPALHGFLSQVTRSGPVVAV
jgi:cell division protease FtsH